MWFRRESESKPRQPSAPLAARAAAIDSKWSRETVAPVGLFGDATMISLVFGVMAARNRSRGKLSESSDCTRINPSVIRPIETSYMKKVGRADERFVSVLKECAGDQVNRFIHAVGQKNLITLQTKVPSDDALNWFALGIDG